VIDAVRELDLEPFYASYRADGHGAAAHDPQMMVSLFAYVYCVGERSSRGIERRCREDVAFGVICANQAPDHATSRASAFATRRPGRASPARSWGSAAGPGSSKWACSRSTASNEEAGPPPARNGA
jgi:hypothetical protein